MVFRRCNPTGSAHALPVFFAPGRGWALVYLAGLLCVLFPAAGLSRPTRFIPRGDAVIVQVLPTGYARIASVSGATARPTVETSELLLATAARTGDTRLAARADAMLASLPETPRVRAARAYSAQHRHDFALALRLLDAQLHADPRDANARLSRAQVHLVQGHIRKARADCALLAFGIDLATARICLAAWSERTGAFEAAARMLDESLRAPAIDRSLLRSLLVARGEVASRARDAGADRWFRKALATAPDDVRTVAAFARHLLRQSRWQDAAALLDAAPRSDTLELMRALAARGLRAPDLAARIAAQRRRYETARAAGATPELRDEAEFELSLRGRPAVALALALQNFENQRDMEDVDILVRAATAARRPDALAELDAWARREGLPGRATP